MGFQSDLDATPKTAGKTGEWIDVCADADVAEGSLVGVSEGGKPMVLARVEGGLYAVGGVCSHAEAMLEDGDLEGWTLVCPLQGGTFDIKTGVALELPPEDPLPTYEVRVEGGRVLVAPKE